MPASRLIARRFDRLSGQAWPAPEYMLLLLQIGITHACQTPYPASRSAIANSTSISHAPS
jgi:hypothetical protein